MEVNLSLPGVESHGSGVRKSRSSTFKACFRCHRRKQRCTGHPTCTNCRSANAACVRDSSVALRRLAGLSKEELLDRIDELEDRLSSSPGPDKLVDSRSLDHEHPRHRSRLPTPGLQAHDVAYDDGTPIGNTSNSQDVSAPADAQLDQRTPLPWPNNDAGRQILNTYLDSMHRRVPFFNFAEVLELHERRHLDLANDHKARFLAFKLFMVYAIGTMVLKLTKVDSDTQPEDYLAIAHHFKSSLRDLSAIERIEIALLNVLYRLRVSLDSESWYEIGLAMRIAVETGLHHEEYYNDLELSLKDWRRRLFWGVYIMERNICFSLKRPFSISEHDIDAGLPSLSLHTNSGSTESLDSHHLEQDPSRRLDLNTFVAIVNLVRIKSDLHTTINRVDRDASFTMAQVPIVLQKIRKFEQTLTNYAGSDHEFLQLHTNNAVRTLIEPFLTLLAPDDQLMTICVQAAGRVCQLFKRLRLRKALGYSFPMVNSVFVAGMTICYVLFKNPSLWTPALANDLRACSSILFVIAERNQGLRKYCDVLEAIINSVMQHIEDTSSPNTSSVLDDSRAERAREGSPIAFHNLKDTFKQFKFELPSNVYPSYTMNTEPRQVETSGCSLKQAAALRTPIAQPSGDPGAATLETYATRDSMYLGDDLLSFDQTPLGLDLVQDPMTGGGTAGLYIHEPYTQQMMEELLAQNYFK